LRFAKLGRIVLRPNKEFASDGGLMVLRCYACSGGINPPLQKYVTWLAG
jgi:hypothetical protein